MSGLKYERSVVRVFRKSHSDMPQHFTVYETLRGRHFAVGGDLWRKMRFLEMRQLETRPMYSCCGSRCRLLFEEKKRHFFLFRVKALSDFLSIPPSRMLRWVL